ncbi:alpha-xyloside ABC transporter [Gracilibacillus boraciitolerans JCM 21714]|uniref:Alpha-xyloside ABC transporter n=1 Tax=Gracilibacillus boraciitolerans JCM 21714 TaxID=1298598 RepID=W4VQU0_9BACI|nr:sugar ABC transporter substrate-binding protein [Gracilibacillus boraciitolerans]GAE95264.1 alpha-xyloside ABC transporter [Gracilibacillus boraciitolerans JCM 21714]
MKKVLLGIFSLIAIFLVLSACSGDNENASSDDNQDTDVTETDNGEVKNIELWYYWENPGHQKSLGGMIDEYNESQDEVVVEATYIPFADFKKQLSVGAGASELPDIVIHDSPDMASYASMGIYADVTEEVSEWEFYDQYFDGPLESAKLDDKLYGVPFGSNALGFYYNKKMLEEAGVEVPTTWEELEMAAEALTTDNVFGVAFSSVQNEEGTFNFMPWIWSAGGDAYDMNSEAGVKSLNYVSGLVDQGLMPKEVINWTQGDVLNQFMSGNVAMMVNGPWQIPTLESSDLDFEWDVTFIPKDKEFASVLGGENFGIIDGENVDASLDFVKFMAENTEEYINDFGYIASRADIAATQFDGGDVNPTYKKFAEIMDVAKPRGPHPRWPEISNAISLSFNEAITGISTPEEAAEKAQTAIDDVLSE